LSNWKTKFTYFITVENTIERCNFLEEEEKKKERKKFQLVN